MKSQIEQMGITTDCYDEIVTSGDAAQESLFSLWLKLKKKNIKDELEK